jgi:5-deoxy-D-glucuronate isomerase
LYPYSNKAALFELRVEGDNDKLSFKTKTEEATVLISADNRIQEVAHMDLKNRKEQRILPVSAHHIVVGAGNWQRDVYHFLTPSPSPHLQLRLGLTVHRGEGTWSSLPHMFENYPEAGFEEMFFYLLSGCNRKAIQVGRGMWADGSRVDAVWPVQDRVFSVIPMGYHPVVGEPGVSVSYIWAYLAKKKEWEKI